MDFQIAFTPTPLQQKLDLANRLIAVGSCFSEHIATRLTANKISCLQHPFGTLYHPNAIARSLMVTEGSFSLDDVITHQGLYFHWNAHSRLWGNTPEELNAKYDKAIKTVQRELARASWIIITIGSSYEYKLIDRNKPVANCHKLSESHFQKQISSVSEMLEKQRSMQTAIEKINPTIRFLYTVSPVRHVRDGLRENHISKGRLLEVAATLSQASNVHYFPSYEIITDQLRDYRFYKRDGIHPNDQAVDYIWELLIDKWFSKDLKSFITNWTPIKHALNHRALYPDSTVHKQFCESMIQKLMAMETQVDTSKEVAYFRSQIQ